MGKLWESYDVKKYARRGHVQHGVDFFGTSLRGVCGGQSKLHEATNALTKKEVLKEIKKAEGFKPKLDTYVILTTTKRDPALQTLIMEKTLEHRKAGLFAIDIRFWDDIEELLDQYTDVRDNFYGGLSADAAGRIDGKLDAILDVSGHLITTKTTDEPGDFHQEIEAAVKRTQDGQPDEALGILRMLRKEKWGSLNNRQKYRVLGNIGHALNAKEEFQEAAECFIQAKSFQPNDIKARCSEALGLYNLGKREVAFTLIEQVRRDDPDIALAAAIWVQSAPEDVPFDTIESSIPEKALKDGDVAMALAIRSRVGGDLDIAESYARIAVSV